MREYGMLWLDTGDRPVAEKIAAAAAYYRRKYGEPRVCYVPLGAAPPDLHMVDGVVVRQVGWMPAGHFWVGEEEESPAREAVPNP